MGGASNNIVKINLVDMNLTHVNGISDIIYLDTNKDFVWKVLDLANRIVAAASEFAGINLELN